MDFASYFLSLDYLKSGTPKQQRVYTLLQQHGVFEKLKEFSPVLAGTIPINIDIDTSDLDILCCFTRFDKFKLLVQHSFSEYPNYAYDEKIIREYPTALVRFDLEEFNVEIFAQPRPIIEQEGFQHMIIEHSILQQRGESFRQQIIELKRSGLKTEPAFAKALQLSGDPYLALLQYPL